MNRYQQITLTPPQPSFILALTIGCEVGATLLLKTSDGFTHPLPSAASAFGFVLAIVFLAKVLEVIPTSIAYTVWTGVAPPWSSSSGSSSSAMTSPCVVCSASSWSSPVWSF